MRIELPEGLVCRWCGDERLDLIDTWVSEIYGFEHVGVVMHCTWCTHLMESVCPVIDGVICPRRDRRVWRDVHSDVVNYSDTYGMGYKRESWGIPF
jgi:hypothetical protein